MIYFKIMLHFLKYFAAPVHATYIFLKLFLIR